MKWLEDVYWDNYLLKLHGSSITTPQAVFFSGPLGGKFLPLSFEFPPQTATNFVWFFGYYSHFLSPQKQFPPQNYISRKKPNPKILIRG